MDYMKMKGMIL